jgi:hypothetical protein
MFLFVLHESEICGIWKEANNLREAAITILQSHQDKSYQVVQLNDGQLGLGLKLQPLFSGIVHFGFQN